MYLKKIIIDKTNVNYIIKITKKLNVNFTNYSTLGYLFLIYYTHMEDYMYEYVY